MNTNLLFIHFFNQVQFKGGFIMNTEQLKIILVRFLGISNNILWGPIMLVLLLGTGILFTIKLKGIQVTKLKLAFKQIFAKSDDSQSEVGLSPLQSLTTAIAAQVGTGNLAGVATAIASGGPGAIFWMWLSGFFGMGTICAEAVLAQLFKESKNGKIIGGPAYYISKGLNSKFLAGFFAVSIVFALGFMGNIVQSNSISKAILTVVPSIPPIAIGIILAILSSMILFGGITRIGSFTEKVVPLMAALYIIGSIIICIFNADMIGPAFKMIFHGAFNPRAATGGLIGATFKETFRYGIARGIFSNEAGMGSSPHAHAIAKVKHPVDQGLVAMIGVIVDTGIVCTLTALVILTTGQLGTNSTGIELTQAGFEIGFSNISSGSGSLFIAICLFCFAFSTIISWYFYGEQNIRYLFGNKHVKYYQIIALICITIGPLFTDVNLVWSCADFFNAIMVIPNLIALVGLANLVTKTVNEYNIKSKK